MEKALLATDEEMTRCQDRPMATLPGWGETFFGFYKENPNRGISRGTVRNMTRQKYQELLTVTDKVLLVAALYIPGDGIYFGTIAHGAGQQKFKDTAEQNAPILWSNIKLCKAVTKNVKENDPPPSLYHAEDVAMYNYESNNPALARYPEFSFIVAYGRKFLRKNGNTVMPQYWDPCEAPDAKITPNCKSVLNQLGINH